jgi:hypothetical protein
MRGDMSAIEDSQGSTSRSVTRGTEPDKVRLALGSTPSRLETDGRTRHPVTSISASVAIGRRRKFQEYCYRGQMSLLLGDICDIYLAALQR